MLHCHLVNSGCHICPTEKTEKASDLPQLYTVIGKDKGTDGQSWNLGKYFKPGTDNLENVGYSQFFICSITTHLASISKLNNDTKRYTQNFDPFYVQYTQFCLEYIFPQNNSPKYFIGINYFASTLSKAFVYALFG